MKLNELTKTNARSDKRLGRGLGSGKGKTGGRGTKGQKARGKIPAGFIGGTLPLYKKLPLKRGQGNPKLKLDVLTVNLSQLASFAPKTVIDLEELVKGGIIKQRDMKKGVKILSTGEIKNALIVKLPASKQAIEKIEKAGGKVENA